MTIEELNTTLRAKAISLGACEKGMNGWECQLDYNELIRKYVENIEFSIDMDFPSNAFIKKNFSRVDLASQGVYCDEKKLNADNRNGTIILNGDCEGVIKTSNFNVLKMYVRGGSDIIVSASGRSKVFIFAYNHCKLHVHQTDAAKVYVYKKSRQAKIFIDGDVKVREGRN